MPKQRASARIELNVKNGIELSCISAAITAAGKSGRDSPSRRAATRRPDQLHGPGRRQPAQGPLKGSAPSRSSPTSVTTATTSALLDRTGTGPRRMDVGPGARSADPPAGRGLTRKAMGILPTHV